MIGIVDYGAGNIFSVKHALDYLGMENMLTDDPAMLRKADAVILPGVGAFPAAMRMLTQKGLVSAVQEAAKQKPLLGICLGMQMLLEKSYEFEECAGLGLIPGTVEPLDAPGLIIPHMGWNKLEMGVDCPLLHGLGERPYVYFVHSFAAKCAEKDLAAWVTYGSKVPAMVYNGSYVFGAQFHPEKSGEVGLQILRNFGGLV